METQNLIYLISCAVNGVKLDTERGVGMDLDAIFSLASRHMLAATVAPALKAAGIQDKRFAKALEHSALKSSTMDMEMVALFAELDAAEIWHMPLKGTVLQHMYKYKILLPLLPFYRTFRSMKAGRFQEEAKAIKNAKR